MLGRSLANFGNKCASFCRFSFLPSATETFARDVRKCFSPVAIEAVTQVFLFFVVVVVVVVVVVFIILGCQPRSCFFDHSFLSYKVSP